MSGLENPILVLLLNVINIMAIIINDHFLLSFSLLLFWLLFLRFLSSSLSRIFFHLNQRIINIKHFSINCLLQVDIRNRKVDLNLPHLSLLQNFWLNWRSVSWWVQHTYSLSSLLYLSILVYLSQSPSK